VRFRDNAELPSLTHREYRMTFKSDTLLPVEVVFGPSWWHKRHGINFDRGFFFDPVRRVRDEQRMRQTLYDTFGDLGLGENDSHPRPVIGAVHLGAGYFIAEALGCRIIFHDDAPPDTLPMNMDDEAFENWEPPALSDIPVMKDLERMVNTLQAEFGYVEGDVNWSGTHNAALDLRSTALYTDYYDRPEALRRFMDRMADFLLSFVQYLDSVSSSSSISVNRSVRLVNERLHLISNCTISMISRDFYEEFLLAPDKKLAAALPPYGIHHCGSNMEDYAESYASVGAVFFDVGWGSDVRACRAALPDAFFNLRLNPARLATCTPDDIAADVNRLAAESGRLDLTGFCCINMDDTVPDENIRALYHAVEGLRERL
jgi:hypothetical protein